MYMLPRFRRFYRTTTLAVATLTLSFVLSSCVGVARGITEAVMESQSEVDARLCEIEGGEFRGIASALDAQKDEGKKAVKVLMVHGVSDHLPGYSDRFQHGLLERLKLNVVSANTKVIRLKGPVDETTDNDPEAFATLRVSSHMNEQGERRLIFYELTWSPITRRRKDALKADSANNYGLKRADVNGYIKTFLNETVPDMLVYNGFGHNKIIRAVGESLCFMVGDTWETLPDSGAHRCIGRPEKDFYIHAEEDSYFFVTHSLGSRITIDALQEFIAKRAAQDHASTFPPKPALFANVDFTIFMLANQLPLLQTGLSTPDFLFKACPSQSERAAGRLDIIAFSDPNDILSYPLQSDFVKETVDPALCPKAVNVSLQLAQERSLFDAASFANPMDAHSGYMEDERVIALVTDGLHASGRKEPIKSRCRWQIMRDDNTRR